MALFDFLKGEKKGEPGKLPELNLSPLPELNLGSEPKEPAGLPSFESNPAFSHPADNPPFNPAQFQQHPTYPTQAQQFPSYQAQQLVPQPGSPEKDLQIIISKLDTIRAELDSMSQRIMKIERIAEQSVEQPPRAQLQRKFGWERGY